MNEPDVVDKKTSLELGPGKSWDPHLWSECLWSKRQWDPQHRCLVGRPGWYRNEDFSTQLLRLGPCGQIKVKPLLTRNDLSP